MNSKAVRMPDGVNLINRNIIHAENIRKEVKFGDRNRQENY